MTTEQGKWIAIQREEGNALCIEWLDDDRELRLWNTSKTIEELEDEYNQYCMDIEEIEDKVPTWDEWIKDNYEEVEVEEYNDDNNDWKVYTNSEADEAWDKELDYFIDDCVLPEIPERYRGYFDDEKYKQDCKYDGRGHSLARYDGCEREQEVEGTTYYLYKQ